MEELKAEIELLKIRIQKHNTRVESGNGGKAEYWAIQKEIEALKEKAVGIFQDDCYII